MKLPAVIYKQKTGSLEQQEGRYVDYVEASYCENQIVIL